KSWNRYVGEPVRPPFLIEVMGLDLVCGACGAYPTEMGEFFATAASRVTEDWPDPAGLAPDVNDVVMPEERAVAAGALRKAHEAATRAQRLEDEGLESEAISAWRDLLGPFFPAG
ncbi:MAG TPA: nucleotidyltransferase, partial [Anaerolineae bacterium]|nr:nucleotidyltransferase [Anaerolineae bacterium]